MWERNPNRSRGIQAAWILATALMLAVPVARAQQPAPRAPHPIYRTYQRPITARPVARPPIQPPIQSMIARPMPVRPMIRPLRGTSTVRTSIAPELFAPRSFAPYSFTPPAVFHAGAFQPRGAWIGARGYFNSFLFGGWPLNAYGYWQLPPNEQMLPLGFGLWPACDSASIPGRFWSAGPCFGVGDYQSLATNYQNELRAESAPQYYPPALEFIVQPEAALPSKGTKPSQLEKKPNMVVCLTNGTQTEVSDWWVTGGNFSFIPMNGPMSGKIQTVDLDSLDLQKTIEQNEGRGRTFILNFTPPDERPKFPALSNQ